MMAWFRMISTIIAGGNLENPRNPLVEADTFKEAQKVLLDAGYPVVMGYEVHDSHSFQLGASSYSFIWHKMADGVRIPMAVQEGT